MPKKSFSQYMLYFISYNNIFNLCVLKLTDKSCDVCNLYIYVQRQKENRKKKNIKKVERKRKETCKFCRKRNEAF